MVGALACDHQQLESGVCPFSVFSGFHNVIRDGFIRGHRFAQSASGLRLGLYITMTKSK